MSKIAMNFHSIFRFLLILTMIFPAIQPVQAQAVKTPAITEDPDLITIMNDETHLVRYMSSETGNPIFTPSNPETNLQSTDIAYEFLISIGAGFGLSDPANELQVMEAQQEEDGREFIRFQQVFEGIPVVGGELIIQLDADGSVLSASGETTGALEISTQPALTSDTARQLAVQLILETYPHIGFEAEEISLSEPELWIYDSILLDTLHERQQSLVWKVVATTDPLTQKNVSPLHHVIYINAQSGEVTFDFDNLQSLRRDIIDCHDNTDCWLVWWEEYGGSGWYYDTDLNTESDRKATREYLQYFYDFYSSVHDRNSYDNRDGRLTAFVGLYDYSGGFYNNAAWTGKYVLISPNYVTKDVIVHEFTHAVTQYTSKLIYFDQSGAINEAFSDLWGEFVDLYSENGTRIYPWVKSAAEDQNDSTWPHREGYVFDANRYNPRLGYTPSSGANRNLSNPASFGSTYYNWVDGSQDFTGSMPNTTQANGGSNGTYYCGPYDNAGVHHNSGVGNRAGYLISQGSPADGITGLGILKTAKLFYEVQTRLLTSAADYQDLFYALLQAAKNLKFTEEEIQTVRKAGELVQMQIQPCLGKRGYVAPAATRIVSPVGTVSVDPNQPAVVDLVWRQKADATAYQLEIKPSSGAATKIWLNQSDPKITCNAGTCSYRMPLAYGLRYSWRIQTRNAVGDGPWTAYAAFTLPYANGSTSTQLLAPENLPAPPVESIRPQFKWEHHPANADYILKIYRVGVDALGVETKTLFLSSSYNAAKYCSNAIGECQGNIAKSLAPVTTYEWLVLGKRGTVTAPETVDTPRRRFTTTSKPLAVLNLGTTTETLLPTISWTVAGGDTASSYNLLVSGPGGKFTVPVTCSSINCSVTLTRSLEGGSNTFQVNSVNQFGTTLGPKITVLFAHPDQKPVLQPITATNNRPVFEWSSVPRATFYLVSAQGLAGKYAATVPSSACASGTCVFRSTTVLKQGDWNWTIQPKNKAGINLSSLSNPGTFTTGLLQPAPLAPMLNEPLQNGFLEADLASGTNSFWLKWQHNLSGAQPTEFIISLFKNGKPAMPVTTLSSSLACSGSPMVCQIATPQLSPGKYTWNVLPLNEGVSGAKSTTRTFSVGPSAPQFVPGNNLSGTLNKYQLSTAWYKQPYVQQYRLMLLRKNGATVSTIYSKTFSNAAICPNDNCQWILPSPLSNGEYSARIFPVSNGIVGLPLVMDFNSSAMVYEDFTTNVDNAITNKWTLDPGFNWSFASGTAIGTTSESGQIFNAQYLDSGNLLVGNVDVTARMKMTGCKRIYEEDCWYGVTLDATPSSGKKVSVFLDPWGNYSVNVGSSQPLAATVKKATTPHKSIARSNWNTLRVVTYNNNLLVYINGVKVYAEQISGISGSGKVVPVFSMATSPSFATTTASRLYLDYIRVYQANPFSVIP